MTHFQIRPIAQETVAAAEARLAAGDPSVIERIIEEEGGQPCRLTLAEAPKGSRVLLFRHRPFAGDGPYAEEGPIFARTDAGAASLAANEVPAFIAAREIVMVRRYDRAGAIAGGELVAGADVAKTIAARLSDDAIEFVHLRSAHYGCFLCEARLA
ncbi:MAG: DUF1203 domain-containing protein [Hyphomonadaceae bacterium]